MSVSAVSSSSTADSSLLASLGVSSSTGDAITTDLKNYEQAKSSGDTSTADAAIVQLKSDLQSEMQQLLESLEGSADDATSDSGDDALSSLLNPNSNSSMDTLLANIQSITAQGTQAASLAAQTASTDDLDSGITTGTQMNVSV